MADGEEIVPAYRADGEYYGDVPRSQVMRPEFTGLYGQAAHLFLIRGDTYAVAVRNREKSSWPNAYDFTASGMSIAGESTLDTIIRESQEELGIDIEAPVEIGSWIPSEGFFSKSTVYVAECPDTLDLNKEDIERLEWVTANGLRELARGDAKMKPDLRTYILSGKSLS